MIKPRMDLGDNMDNKYERKQRIDSLPDNLIGYNPPNNDWRVIPLAIWSGSNIIFSGTKEQCIDYCKSKNESFEVISP